MKQMNFVGKISVAFLLLVTALTLTASTDTATQITANATGPPAAQNGLVVPNIVFDPIELINDGPGTDTTIAGTISTLQTATAPLDVIASPGLIGVIGLLATAIIAAAMLSGFKNIYEDDLINRRQRQHTGGFMLTWRENMFKKLRHASTVLRTAYDHLTAWTRKRSRVRKRATNSRMRFAADANVS